MYRIQPVGHAVFTDDFIFADVAVHCCAIIQAEINQVVQWSDEMLVPVKFEKFSFMHLRYQPS